MAGGGMRKRPKVKDFFACENVLMTLLEDYKHYTTEVIKNSCFFTFALSPFTILFKHSHKISSQYF